MFSSAISKIQTTPKKSSTSSELKHYVDKVQSRLNSPMEVCTTCVIIYILHNGICDIKYNWSEIFFYKNKPFKNIMLKWQKVKNITKLSQAKI